MAIKLSDFAEDCVRQGLRFGVNPHYLVAVAQLRSGISDQNDGARIGPFRLTQEEWDANSSDTEFGISDFVPEDVKEPDMQCAIYALMTLRAQNRLLERLGRHPSAVELYREQWPNDPVTLPDKLDEALKATTALINPAVEKVTGETPTESPTLGNANAPATDPSPDPAKPVPKKGEEIFVVKAPRIMEKLIEDFGLKDFQAAGILGNIGLECAGFRLMQEVKPLGGGRGGFGWCQWTGSRRVDFETLCSTEGLDPTSDAANYANLKRELQTTHKASLDAVKATATIGAAVRAFEKEFERAKAGFEHFDRRDHWAELALNSFNANASTRVPAAVAKILDPDLIYRVVGTAKSGTTQFWVLDQFGEQGGQVLIRQTAGNPPEILAHDTTIFPLKDDLGLPTAVKTALSGSFTPVGDPHPPIASPSPASDEEVAKRVFAEAKKCDETLITRKVPNTNGGRVACAWATNEVVRRAVGKPIGGGLSTAEMAKVLRAKHRQVTDESQLNAGMIVISPTQGSNVGHVGILGAAKSPASATVIFSNSSSRGVFSHAFTLAKWKAFYKTRKGLPVLFFALNK